jgi:hypothetical protein
MPRKAGVGRELPFTFLVFGLQNSRAPIGGCRPIPATRIANNPEFERLLSLDNRPLVSWRAVGCPVVIELARSIERGVQGA